MEENNRIIPAEISKEMKDSYIDYAMSAVSYTHLLNILNQLIFLKK